MREAMSGGFRSIAGFIFGKNLAPGAAGSSSKVAMTSPVTLEMQEGLLDSSSGGGGGSSKIAMTSPVTAEMGPGEASRGGVRRGWWPHRLTRAWDRDASQEGVAGSEIHRGSSRGAEAQDGHTLGFPCQQQHAAETLRRRRRRPPPLLLAGNTYKVSFIMPSKYTLETLPKPGGPAGQRQPARQPASQPNWLCRAAAEAAPCCRFCAGFVCWC